MWAPFLWRPSFFGRAETGLSVFEERHFFDWVMAGMEKLVWDLFWEGDNDGRDFYFFFFDRRTLVDWVLWFF